MTDLESSNGTFLNGQKITREILQNGDKITIGEHILRFDLLDEIDREYQRQIRRLLSHDDLTGLLSSRSFFSELRREAARAGQENRPFCVLMMDVDYFKAVNDTYGHLTGSKTLEEIGLCITQNLRSGDVAARFGGEEFAAFLLDASVSQAIVAAERIRSASKITRSALFGRARLRKLIESRSASASLRFPAIRATRSSWSKWLIRRSTAPNARAETVSASITI